MLKYSYRSKTTSYIARGCKIHKTGQIIQNIKVSMLVSGLVNIMLIMISVEYMSVYEVKFG